MLNLLAHALWYFRLSTKHMNFIWTWVFLFLLFNCIGRPVGQPKTTAGSVFMCEFVHGATVNYDYIEKIWRKIKEICGKKTSHNKTAETKKKLPQTARKLKHHKSETSMKMVSDSLENMNAHSKQQYKKVENENVSLMAFMAASACIYWYLTASVSAGKNHYIYFYCFVVLSFCLSK